MLSLDGTERDRWEVQGSMFGEVDWRRGEDRRVSEKDGCEDTRVRSPGTGRRKGETGLRGVELGLLKGGGVIRCSSFGLVLFSQVSSVGSWFTGPMLAELEDRGTSGRVSSMVISRAIRNSMGRMLTPTLVSRASTSLHSLLYCQTDILSGRRPSTHPLLLPLPSKR